MDSQPRAPKRKSQQINPKNSTDAHTMSAMDILDTAPDTAAKKIKPGNTTAESGDGISVPYNYYDLVSIPRCDGQPKLFYRHGVHVASVPVNDEAVLQTAVTNFEVNMFKEHMKHILELYTYGEGRICKILYSYMTELGLTYGSKQDDLETKYLIPLRFITSFIELYPQYSDIEKFIADYLEGKIDDVDLNTMM